MFKYLAKLLALLALLSSQIAMADPAVYLNDAGVALSGNDPVAYFTAKAPVKGQPTLSTKYQDATYWFSSQENRTAFLAEPSKYAPSTVAIAHMQHPWAKRHQGTLRSGLSWTTNCTSTTTRAFKNNG
jgi:YHS domain-containing protein